MRTGDAPRAADFIAHLYPARDTIVSRRLSGRSETRDGGQIVGREESTLDADGVESELGTSPGHCAAGNSTQAPMTSIGSTVRTSYFPCDLAASRTRR